MSEKSSVSQMADVAILLRQLAEPRPVDDSIKQAINRAARRAGLTYSRAKSLWYREAKAWAHEIEMIKSKLSASAGKKEQALHGEIKELRARISAIEECLVATLQTNNSALPQKASVKIAQLLLDAAERVNG